MNVTRKMINAGHDVMLKRGMVLSYEILEEIYMAMDQAATPERTPFDTCPTCQALARAVLTGMFDEEPDGDPHGECAMEIKTLQARIAELEAQVDALKVDAERYRWLRDGCDHKGGEANRIVTREYGGDWDAAIDAAMKESGQ